MRWEASVRYMIGSGVGRALEIGPGKVLSGLVKRIDKDLEVLSVGDAVSLGKVIGFLGANSNAGS